MIFVMGWEIYVLSEVERGQKRKKLGSVVVCSVKVVTIEFYQGWKRWFLSFWFFWFKKQKPRKVEFFVLWFLDINLFV